MTSDEVLGLPTGDPATTGDRIKGLAAVYHVMLSAKNIAKGAYEEAEANADAAERELFDAIENAGLTAVRTEVGLFSLNDLAWPRVEDRDRLVAWAEAEHPELLTLNLQRLQTPLREALKSGAELPPGLTYSLSRKIRFTPPR